MDTSTVKLAVVDGKTVTQAVELHGGAQGMPVKVKAIKGGKFVLADQKTGHAPENITVKRVGKNLHVGLEGDAAESPSLIIEDYYGSDSQLVGLGEDGAYHEYVLSGAGEEAAAAAAEGASAPAELGAQPLAGMDGLTAAPAAAASPWVAALFGVGVLGMVGAAIASGGGSDNSTNAGAPGTGTGTGAGAGNGTFRVTSISDGEITNNNTPTLSGTGRTPGDIVTITVGGEAIGTAVVGPDGQWSFPLNNFPLPEGASTIQTIERDASGNEVGSASVTVFVDTVRPDAGTITDIADDVGIYQGTIANNGVTDDSTPTLRGRAESGATVIIRDGDREIASVVADTNGIWRYTPDNPLDDGTYRFNIIVRDGAGNVSDPSSEWTVTVDTIAPNVPQITSVFDDVGGHTGELERGDVTDDATPTVRGTAEAGALVVLYDRIDGNRIIGSAIADAVTGEWQITADTLLNGPHKLAVRAYDTAGNWSRFTADFDITVTTGGTPTAPSIINVLDDVGSVTGNIAPGGVTDDTRPTVIGSAQPGSLVRLYDVINGTEVELGSAIAGPGGRWEITPDEAHALSEGPHNLKATAELGGVVSPPTGLYPIEVDLTAPGALNPPELIDDVGSITGPIASGSTTDDATPTFKGTGGTPGDTVIIRDNGNPIGSTIVGDDGAWEFTPTTPLPDGDHSFTAQPVDPVGNAGPITAPIEFVVDTGAVEVSITSVTDDTGAITGAIAPGGVTDDDTPTITGRATANGVVKVYDGTTLLGSTIAGPNGIWTLQVTDPKLQGQGEHTLRATVTVPGQLESDPATFTLILDTVAPAAGSIDDVHDDVGSLQGTVADGGVTDDNTPTLSGQAEAGATVIVRNGDEVIGSTIANSEGEWKYTPGNPLEDGSYDFNIIVRDAAGNSSVPSDAWTVIIDTDIPKPAIGDISDNTDPANLIPIEDGGVTKDRTPVIGGEGGTPGDTIIVIVDDQEVGTTIVGDDGKWEFEIPTDLNDGEHKFEVVERDPAGNEAKSDPVTVIVDGTPPGALLPPTLTDDVGDITGPIVNGTITDDNVPTFAGTGGEAGDTIVVRDNGTVIGTAIVKDDGSWTFEPATPLPDGDHSFTAQPVDPAGNAGPETTPIDFVVDTQAPGALQPPTLTDDVGDITGPIVNGTITDDNVPTFAGTGGEAGDTIVVRDNGTVIGTAIVKDDGSWTFEPATPLPDGDHSFTAQPVDAAGNKGPETTPIDFVVDTQAPAAPVITEVFDDAGAVTGIVVPGTVTDDTQPTVRGTAERGSLVTLYDGTRVVGSAIADAMTGEWVIPATATLLNGGHVLTAKATDRAGNTSEASGEYDFTVRTGGVPSAPAITNVRDNVGPVTGNVQPGGTTDDARPVMIGTAQPDSIVRIYEWNGSTDVLLGTAIADPAGNWIYPLTEANALSDGTHSFRVTAELDGEITMPSGLYPITVDTSAVGTSSVNDISAAADTPAGIEVLSDAESAPTQGSQVVELSAAEYLHQIELKGTAGVIDTLKLTGENQVLDFSKLAGQVSSVEVVDITGSGDNTLKLSLADVMEQGGKDLFIADGKTQMMVKGNEGDTVELSDLLKDGSDVGDWAQQSGTVTVAGEQYNVYYHEATNTELLVQLGVTTHLDNH